MNKNVILYVNGLTADGGDGSINNPFNSIQKAVEARRLIDGGNVIISVAGGSYFFEEPVILNKNDSRTTFVAEGSVEIKGAFSADVSKIFDYEKDAKIKCIQLEKNLDVDAVFINDGLQVMARYPNFTEGAVPLGNVVSASEIKKRIKNYKSVEGAHIRAIHINGWGGNSYYADGLDDSSDTGLKLRWIGDNNRGSKYDPEKMLIENIFEELDDEKEWFYDKNSGILYFIPENGVKLEKLEICTTSELFEINGADNISFDGFLFTKTARTMFRTDRKKKQYIPLLRGDWCVVRSGAVLIKNSEFIIITNSKFENILSNAVFIYGKNRRVLIHENEFSDIGSTCVCVVGSPNAVYEPSFWEHDYYNGKKGFTIHKTTIDEPDKTGPKTDEYPKEITISQNVMHKMGLFEKQSTGVNISAAQFVKILHNTIFDSPRSCINVNDGCFGGHEIAYNDVFNSQRETTDHGPFNSWGRDRFWSVPQFNAAGRFGEQIEKYALLDVTEPIEIHDNRFHHMKNAPHSWGIDLDDGSSNYRIYNNLCLGIGIKLREGFRRRVYNNIIVDGQFQLHCPYTGAKDEIYSNVVINAVPYGYALLGDNIAARLTDCGDKIDKNVYFCYSGDVNFNETYINSDYDKNAVIKDPEFKNIENCDFTVTNNEVLEKTGFKNFSMNEFGRTDCTYKPPKYILDTVKKAEELQEFEYLGAKISNVDYTIMSATATKGTDGVYFKDVPENSEAYRRGFRTHTVIKELEGKTIKNVNEFLKFF